MIVLVYGTATGYSVMKYDIVLVHGKFLLRFCAPRAKVFARGARARILNTSTITRAWRARAEKSCAWRARDLFFARVTPLLFSYFEEIAPPLGVYNI